MARAAQVKAEVVYGADDYDTPPSMDNMDPWTVTLRFRKRQMTVPFYTGLGCRDHGTGEPTARTVMECLLSDVGSFRGASNVDDFMDELGFSKPSEAIRCYEACRRVDGQMERFLRDELDEALEDTEVWLKEHTGEEG